MKFCSKCGAKLEEGKKFCNKCGNPIVANTENNNNNVNIPKEKVKIEKSINNVNSTKIDDTLYKSAISNNSPMPKKTDNKKNTANKNSNSNYSGKIILGILCSIIVIIGVFVGIFFNSIKAEYYMSKCEKAYVISEKLDYAEKAILSCKNDKTKDFVKQIFSEAADSDIDIAEKKLNNLYTLIDSDDYKEIALEVKNKKLSKLCENAQYEDAVRIFKDIKDLGGDFRKNKYYDDIMLNEISRITGSSKASSKNSLMESQAICYDNFDDDPYDEILEVTNGDYYDNYFKINLYKYEDGQYKQAGTKLINNYYSPSICGVYKYDKDTVGMYLQYYNDDSEIGLGVFDVIDGRPQLMGAVFSNNYTKPDDINNDGIYEVLSNSMSIYSYSGKGISKWYKINSNGLQPSEINDVNKKSISSKDKKEDLKNVDYIFPESSSKYLKDDDVKDLSKYELSIARNEIFARNGYVFTTKEYADYFNSKDWYEADSSFDGDIEKLNKYEKANVELIKKYEE